MHKVMDLQVCKQSSGSDPRTGTFHQMLVTAGDTGRKEYSDFRGHPVFDDLSTSAKEVLFFDHLFVSLSAGLCKYYWLELSHKKIRRWVLVQRRSH